MKDFSRSVLSSEGIALDIEQRLNWLLVLFAAIFFVFSATNYLQGSTAMAVSDIIVAGCILLINFVLQKRIISAASVVYLLLLLVTIAVISELLFQGSISNFLYYYGVIPFYVYYIAGKRIATGYTIFLLVVVWAIWFLSKATSTLEFQYSLQELLFFTPLLAFSAFCAWLFEEDRHETEEMSYEAGLRHESLLEAIGEVYYRVDTSGQIIEMSSALYQITGYKPSEVIMNPTIDFYAYPEERQGYMELLTKNGSVENYSITLIGKAGNHIRILMSSRLIYDKKGDPMYIEGMFRDVTKEQKIAEERKQQVEYMQALSAVEEALAHSDLEQSIQEALNTLRSTFQAKYTFLVPSSGSKDKSLLFLSERNHVTPFSLNDFLNEDEIQAYLASIPKQNKGALLAVEGKGVFSTRVHKKYGFQSHLLTLIQGQDTQNWLLCIHDAQEDLFAGQRKDLFIDVTRRIEAALKQLLLYRALEKKAEEAGVASKAKGDFVATMSHELRTPLHGIIGLLDLLQSDIYCLPEEQQRNLVLAQSSAGILSSLIDDVLDISKIEAGGIDIQRQAFDLKKAVCDALLPFVVKAREKGIELRMEMRDVACVVEGDVLRLRQVLLNLVGNAVKFTKCGYVRIAVSQGDDYLQINVEDSGIGIKREKQEEVFNAFAQVHDVEVMGSNLQEKGTGLGTTIAHHFVKMMGGTLTLRSEPNVGSTMSIRLPLCQVGEEKVSVNIDMQDLVPEPNKTASEPKEKMQQQWSVLLAEDDPIGRRIVIKRLEKEGFAVEAVNDGLEALECIKARDYDLLLTDLRMPKLNGLQLTREVRAFEKEQGKKHMLVIGLSAYAMEDIKQEALDSGMDNFITKPIDMSALVKLLVTK